VSPTSSLTVRSVVVGRVPETVAGLFFRRAADGDGRCTLLAMPAFDIAFMRVDREQDPTIVEGFFRTVDWPVLPREGEGLDLGNDCPVTVESIGFGFDGYPNVFVGRVVLDDLRVAQLRKLGWRVSPLPSVNAELSVVLSREVNRNVSRT